MLRLLRTFCPDTAYAVISLFNHNHAGGNQEGENQEGDRYANKELSCEVTGVVIKAP